VFAVLILEFFPFLTLPVRANERTPGRCRLAIPCPVHACAAIMQMLGLPSSSAAMQSRCARHLWPGDGSPSSAAEASVPRWRQQGTRERQRTCPLRAYHWRMATGATRLDPPRRQQLGGYGSALAVDTGVRVLAALAVRDRGKEAEVITLSIRGGETRPRPRQRRRLGA